MLKKLQMFKMTPTEQSSPAPSLTTLTPHLLLHEDFYSFICSLTRTFTPTQIQNGTYTYTYKYTHISLLSTVCTYTSLHTTVHIY